MPKGYDAADYILGHRVKNHMTVISEDGALSEAERVGKFLYESFGGGRYVRLFFSFNFRRKGIWQFLKEPE